MTIHAYKVLLQVCYKVILHNEERANGSCVAPVAAGGLFQINGAVCANFCSGGKNNDVKV